MVGSTISHYTITGHLGRGGMGEVYLAIDTRLNRKVALKFVSMNLRDDRTAQERLLREARAAATLDHPFICKVYEAAEVDGQAFIALEYIDGETLADRLRHGPLPFPEALTVALEIAEALDVAHEHGIVHRDLKPGNIMVGRGGHIKVMDFGLAKQMRPEIGSDSAETVAAASLPGTTAGTLAYMSPEQLRGKPADARSDVFAFGLIFCEMLTGRHPLRGGTAIETASAILADAPVLLSGSDVISPVARHVMQRMLQKNPDDRYHAARDVLTDLRLLRSDTPVSGSATAATVGSLPIATRARGRVLGVAIGVMSVVLTLAAVLWLTRSRPVLSFAPREWVVIGDFENQTGEPIFDQSLNTAMAVSLQQSKYANVVSRARIATALRRMQKPPEQKITEEIGREICQRERIRGLIMPSITRIGQQYSLAARIVDPVTGDVVSSHIEPAATQNDVLRSLDALVTAIRTDLGESLASIKQNNRELAWVTTSSLEALKSYSDGGVMWAKGDYEAAVTLYQNAVKLDPDFAKAHAALGLSYHSFIYNDLVTARRHFEKALTLADRVTERERQQIEIQYEDAIGDTARAFDLFRSYLQRYPDDTVIRYNYGNALRDRGFLKDAAEQYQEVIRINANSADAHMNLATCYALLEHIDDALRSYTRAFELEPSWKSVPNINHEYGFSLVQAGRGQDARALFNSQLETSRMTALRSSALLDQLEGKYRQARARLEEAIRMNAAGKAVLSESRNHLFAAIMASGQGDAAGRRAELDLAGRGLLSLGHQVWMMGRVGVAWVRAGDVGKARVLLDQMRKDAQATSFADQSTVHRLEGEIALATSDRATAIETLLKADNEEHSPYTTASLANAYRITGDRASAITQYERLIADEGGVFGGEPQQDWLDAHAHLARLYFDQQQPQKARDLIERALSRWKDADADVPLLKELQQLRGELDKR